MLELRRVTNPTDPAIAQFGRLQQQTYFEPDMLIPAAYIARMLEWNDASRANILLVIEENTAVVAGCLFHYLQPANTGFSSYLAVAASHRGRGLARRLHEARLEALEGVAGQPVEGLFIDVVNPARLNSAELKAERTVQSDPVTRLKVFATLGFRRVNLR